MVNTDKYTPREWPEHVRRFYVEWLRETGLQANNAQAFDRFVSRMEEMFGDYLADPTLDHADLTRRENE